jgi:capsular polysaccharide biosynthesis protein
MKRLLKKALNPAVLKYFPYNTKYKTQGINKDKSELRYINIHPSFTSNLGFSIDLYHECPEYIMTPREVDVPPAYVVEAENGRIYSTFAYIAIMDKRNFLIPEVSYHHVAINKIGAPEENPVLRTKMFIDPVKFNGAVFSMISGGGAVTNYGHWLIDALPRIGLLKKSGLFGEVDWFLVPNYQYDFHKESLSLLGIPSVKIIKEKAVDHIIADKIIASTTPRHIGHFPLWAAEFLRESFLPSTPVKNYPPFAYIRRSDSAIRRIINEDDLVAELKPLGFIDYELSRLSFSQKVNLFRSARIIVSATGAGLSNIVFCNPKTTVLELFYSSFMSTMFANIAVKVDLEYQYLINRSGKKTRDIKEGEIGHFSINVGDVVRKVKTLKLSH